MEIYGGLDLWAKEGKDYALWKGMIGGHRGGEMIPKWLFPVTVLSLVVFATFSYSFIKFVV
jgi:hypothetical protein